MTGKRLWPAVTALMLAACSGTDEELASPAPAQDPGWKTVATEADRDRLRRWWDAWQEALADAREAGHGADIEAQGSLLVPDAAVDRPDLPPGHYRCRTIKLGIKGEGGLAYLAYPPFDCAAQVQDGLTKLVKLTGSQRPVGLVYPDTSRRSVFLGALELGDEQAPMAYGIDASRDMIGLVERIGPRTWRLVFPWPAFESKLDVVELVPASE